LRSVRAAWLDGNLAALKILERLRTFFRFAQGSHWIEQNPATELKNPKVSARPTLPYTHEKMIGILEACATYWKGHGLAGQPNARRLRALVLLLRYGGMRIGDAVSCAVERLNGNKFLLYTQKTGVPVYCPLPDFVVKVLAEIPRSASVISFGRVSRNSQAPRDIGKPS
jgi:integrase